jgi:hypothetical protein
MSGLYKNNPRETRMRTFKILLAMAFVSGGLFALAAQPASAKDAPGKCGVGKFFDKKTGKCTSK